MKQCQELNKIFKNFQKCQKITPKGGFFAAFRTSFGILGGFGR